MIPGLGRSPGRGHGNPLQYSYLENPLGQRSLAGYSPWGHTEPDTTEATWHAHTHSSSIPSVFKESPHCSPQRLYKFTFPPTVQEGSLFSTSSEPVCRTVMEMRTNRTDGGHSVGGRGWGKLREQRGSVYTAKCKIDSQRGFAPPS